MDNEAELAKHCMEDIDTDFVKKVKAGDVIVAGHDFGCGSSREQAVSCLRGHDLCVVAKDFARIFLQNAVDLGLQAVTCPEIEAARGDRLEITRKWVLNKTSGRRYAVAPLPPTKQAMMDAGGLIPYTRQRLLAGKSARGSS